MPDILRPNLWVRQRRRSNMAPGDMCVNPSFSPIEIFSGAATDLQVYDDEFPPSLPQCDSNYQPLKPYDKLEKHFPAIAQVQQKLANTIALQRQRDGTAARHNAQAFPTNQPSYGNVSRHEPAQSVYNSPTVAWTQVGTQTGYHQTPCHPSWASVSPVASAEAAFQVQEVPHTAHTSYDNGESFPQSSVHAFHQGRLANPGHTVPMDHQHHNGSVNSQQSYHQPSNASQYLTPGTSQPGGGQQASAMNTFHGYSAPRYGQAAAQDTQASLQIQQPAAPPYSATSSSYDHAHAQSSNYGHGVQDQSNACSPQSDSSYHQIHGPDVTQTHDTSNYSSN